MNPVAAHVYIVLGDGRPAGDGETGVADRGIAGGQTVVVDLGIAGGQAAIVAQINVFVQFDLHLVCGSFCGDVVVTGNVYGIA